jgi:hypothetical protein
LVTLDHDDEFGSNPLSGLTIDNRCVYYGSRYNVAVVTK